MLEHSVPLTDSTTDSHHFYTWPINSPKVWVHIIHGMSEHAKRYDEFAIELNKAGVTVTADDHRGHGATGVEMNSLLHLSDKDGWNKIIVDQIKLLDELNSTIKCPLVLFGHSMGSYMALDICQRLSNTHKEKKEDNLKISGLILSGSGYENKLFYQINKFITKLEVMRCGKRKSSALIQKLTFKSFNSQFSPPRTENDWLSTDNAQVDKYTKDPLCGGALSTQSWFDLISGIIRLFDRKNFNNISKDLPIYFVSGNQDPVGKNGKSVVRFKQFIEKQRFNSVDIRLFEGCRHELVNEKKREQFYTSIKAWLTKFSVET